LRLWWEVARRSYRRWSTYRAATVAGVITNTAFGFIQAYVLLAVYRQRGDVGGFDASDALTFTFLAQGLLMPIGIFGWTELAERVTSGDVVTDLYRPVDFQGYWLAQDLGRAGFHVVFRGVPPYVLGALVFDLRVATDGWSWLAFPVSLTLGIVASFGIRFLVNLAAFWILDVRGPVQLLTGAFVFFSGAAIPVTFFPDWLEGLARVLPFAATLQFPVEVALGEHGGGGLVGLLALQLAWVAALLAGGRWVLAAATRKVVIQGG
jgi:ABC-2 type transport system permease protein